MIKPKTKIIVFLLLVPVITGCNGAGSSYGKVTGDVYENKFLGLTISKPDSWEMITARRGKEEKSSAKGYGKIAKLITALNSRPIVSMFKSRRRNPQPAFRITLSLDEESPDVSVIEILNGCSRVGSNTFKDYSVVQPPKEVEVGGCKAGYMKAYYTGEFRGDKKISPISYETWIVPRRGFFFMVGVMSSQTEDVKTQVEITSIIKSIKLN